VIKINIFRKFIVGVLVCVIGLTLANNFAYAQTYQIHEKIPGQTGKEGVINGVNYGKKGVDTLQDYLESAYKFGIAIVAILAVVMIGVGAFMYIVTSAGNAGKLANAKEIITSAILGLVMALLSWLILFVINPDLVGSTLKSIKIDDDNNSWKHDLKPDPNICNITPITGLYEVDRCKGNYVCLGDTCRTKGSIPCTDSDTKFPGVCSKNDSVAHVNEPCGISTGSGDKLVGICRAEKCSGGLIEVNSGKECVDQGNYCCARGL